MLKRFPVFLLASLIQLSQGGTLISNQLYSSCTGAEFFPNFSYAKGLQVATSSIFRCSNSLSSTNLSPPTSINITWFYYDTYVAGQTPSCGNPALPAGDQCCHSTATSTLSFYHRTYSSTPLGVEAISTGNVTAGPFLDQSATWILFDPNVASLNFNCDKAYGQEAWSGLTSINIANGPVCLNGAQAAEACPGWLNAPVSLNLIQV